MSTISAIFGKTAFAGSLITATSWALFKWQKSRHDKIFNTPIHVSESEREEAIAWQAPTRSQLLQKLQSSSDGQFDVVIVGGGATGTGCALDAASRGLKVALLEAEDWSSGTSSKSTKLVHGGVRYLERAIKGLDWQEFEMVSEALRERVNILKMAPHLAKTMPIMIPVYKWWQAPYFWTGSKLYDLVSGPRYLEASRWLSGKEARKAFPKIEGMIGGMLYWDGVQNDARMNFALALTAIYKGAVALNYVCVDALIKDDGIVNDAASGSASNGGNEDSASSKGGRIVAVQATDKLTGHKMIIPTRTVVNATGPFCDTLLRMNNPASQPLVTPSLGTHIVIDGQYGCKNTGLIDPMSSDGRVIFFLPWQGNTLVGTTDTATPSLSLNPAPSRKDIQFIKEQVESYLHQPLSMHQIKSAWTGTRPLLRNPEGNTKDLVRNHIVMCDEHSGLITIAGGKWTTFRKMAEDCIDKVIETIRKQEKHKAISSKTPSSPPQRMFGECQTEKMLLIGAHGLVDGKLAADFDADKALKRELIDNYGDRASQVANLSSESLLPPSHNQQEIEDEGKNNETPLIKGQVLWAIRHEYAQKIPDILARRLRIAHTDCRLAARCIPQIGELMASELGWSRDKLKSEIDEAMVFLDSCGLSDICGADDVDNSK